MKFLIVEDNQSMRRLIKSLLAGLSDSITECGDGAEAHSSYTQHHPDWVVMDLMMPRVDGITATQQIVASDPGARIVIVTDHESRALRRAAQKAGACGYILKENLQDLRRLFMPGAEDPPA